MTNSALFEHPYIRMRRNRQSDWVRRMVCENSLAASDLIWPLFVIDGQNKREAVASMPGVERLSTDLLVEQVAKARELGITAIALFPNTPGELRGAVIFQNHSLLPWLTAYENVELAVKQVFRLAEWKAKLWSKNELEAQPYKRKKSKAEMREWIEYNLSLVHMDHAMDKRPDEISGGMKQRVGIARALAMQPKILLMDEPFGALDALTRAHMQESLMKIHADLKNTVIMITHDVDEAVLLSDKIVMMTNGPAAGIGEILQINLQRPRDRIALSEDPAFNHYRHEVLEFLYARQRNPAQIAEEKRSGNGNGSEPATSAVDGADQEVVPTGSKLPAAEKRPAQLKVVA